MVLLKFENLQISSETPPPMDDGWLDGWMDAVRVF